MSRFVRASHVIWHCQYHVVWVPKYRFRMLQGPVCQEAYKCVMTFCQQLGCEVVELNRPTARFLGADIQHINHALLPGH